MTFTPTLKIENFNSTRTDRKLNIWLIAAIFCFLSGNGAIIIGAVLTVDVWFYQTEILHIPIQTITNSLFYSALPLMYLGAFCLDKLEEEKKKKRHVFQK